jgi:hypothetical protein
MLELQDSDVCQDETTSRDNLPIYEYASIDSETAPNPIATVNHDAMNVAL